MGFKATPTANPEDLEIREVTWIIQDNPELKGYENAIDTMIDKKQKEWNDANEKKSDIHSQVPKLKYDKSKQEFTLSLILPDEEHEDINLTFSLEEVQTEKDKFTSLKKQKSRVKDKYNDEYLRSINLLPPKEE